VEAVLDKPGIELYRVTLTLRFRHEGQQVAAWCDELEVHSCGDTLDEAADNIVDATICYLNAIEELGERPRIFEEQGIEPELWIPERDVPAQREVATSVRPGEYVTHLVAASEREDLQLAG
jgi:predicted RNase H-like HicB family nuclease